MNKSLVLVGTWIVAFILALIVTVLEIRVAVWLGFYWMGDPANLFRIILIGVNVNIVWNYAPRLAKRMLSKKDSHKNLSE